MNLNIILGIIVATSILATPIMVAAIGGLFSERSGVVNIALEGIMVIGAFTAAVTVYFNSGLGSNASWLALLSGALAGLIFALIHAFASISFKADQIISGTALNMLSVAFAVYLSQIIFNQQRTAPIQHMNRFSRIIFYENFGIFPTTIVAIIIVIISYFVIFKTKYGLRLRACGEFPQAAASAGVNVKMMRYSAVMISGFLGGLAGAMLVLTNDTQFTATTINGLGFIALASLIFGRWNPFGVLCASIFFGFANSISLYARDIPLIAGLPSEFFFMLPYILTILALVLFSVIGGYSGPKAAGEVYDEGKR